MAKKNGSVVIKQATSDANEVREPDVFPHLVDGSEEDLGVVVPSPSGWVLPIADGHTMGTKQQMDELRSTWAQSFINEVADPKGMLATVDDVLPLLQEVHAVGAVTPIAEVKSFVTAAMTLVVHELIFAHKPSVAHYLETVVAEAWAVLMPAMASVPTDPTEVMERVMQDVDVLVHAVISKLALAKAGSDGNKAKAIRKELILAGMVDSLTEGLSDVLSTEINHRW